MSKFFTVLTLIIFLLVSFSVHLLPLVPIAYAADISGTWIDRSTIQIDTDPQKGIYFDNKTDGDFTYVRQDDPDNCADEIVALKDGNTQGTFRPLFPNKQNKDNCDHPDNSDLVVNLSQPSATDNYFVWVDKENLRTSDGKHVFTLDPKNPNFFLEEGGDNCKDSIETTPGSTSGQLIPRTGGANTSFDSGYPFHPEGKKSEGGCSVYNAITIQIGRIADATKAPDELLNSDNQIVPDDTNIAGSTQCGVIGAKCCSNEVSLATPKIKFFKVKILGKSLGPLFNAFLTPVNVFIGAIWKVGRFALQDSLKNSIDREACSQGVPSNKRDNLENLKSCLCVKKETFKIGSLCENITNINERNQCAQCSDHGVWTAIGCVNFKIEDFITQKVFGTGVALAGAISMLCILYSAFLLQSSRGDPERIKKAREYLTNCILGLIMVLFSILLLRIIGVDILHIPGFI